MLGRVAARSWSGQAYHPPLRIGIPALQSRTYAKHGKPKRPFEYSAPGSTPINRHGPQAQRLQNDVTNLAPRQAGSPTQENLKDAELPDISRLQGELDGIKQSRLNPQQPAQPDSEPASTSPTSNHREAPSDYSKLQEEFETSSPGDSNAAPQSTSPSAIDPTEIQRQHGGQTSSRPLPDLTQGIPSTLDAEMASSSARSDPNSLNITEDPSQPGGQGGGDLPKSAYISSFERKRNQWANWFYLTALLSAIAGTVVLGRNWETEDEERKHPDAPSGWGFGLFYNRARARLRDTLDYYNEPAFPKLLPKSDPMWERPYTLVLSLEDMLVHSEWSREHGWRMAKRPGVDYFLRYLSQYYELVIFTSIPSMIAQPIIQKLDPYRIVMWPLFREATRYQRGEYIKDLSFLNRDLNKIILIDTVPAHAKLQPENAIIIPKWTGDTKDRELVSFIPFLEYLANMNFEDSRQVLASFEGKHIPTEFARREAILREKFQQQYDAERAKRPKRSIGSSLLGMSSQPGMEPSVSEGFEQGKMMLDIIRERGQKQYEMLEKEIRENGEKWLKEMAEEEKKLNDEAMKGMKSSITNVFPFGGVGGTGGANGKTA